MSIERVKAYFSSLGESERILEFAQSTATVELAAAAVGCEPGMIAKSMTFLVDGAPLLVVQAGDVRVDEHQVKAEAISGTRRAAFARSASRTACLSIWMPRCAVLRPSIRRRATTTAPSD